MTYKSLFAHKAYPHAQRHAHVHEYHTEAAELPLSWLVSSYSLARPFHQLASANYSWDSRVGRVPH